MASPAVLAGMKRTAHDVAGHLPGLANATAKKGKKKDEDETSEDETPAALLSTVLDLDFRLRMLEGAYWTSHLVPQAAPATDAAHTASLNYSANVKGKGAAHPYGPPHLSVAVATCASLAETHKDTMKEEAAALMTYLGMVKNLEVEEATDFIRGFRVKNCYEEQGKDKMAIFTFRLEGSVTIHGKEVLANHILSKLVKAEGGKRKVGPPPRKANARKIQDSLNKLLGKKK